MHVGLSVKSFLAEREMTQVRLSEILKVSPNRVCRMIKRSNMTICTMAKIANALQVKPHEIIERAEQIDDRAANG